MNHWKIVKSIWQKVEAKNPIGTLSAQLSKSPIGYALQTYYGVSWNQHAHDPNQTAAFKLVCSNYNEAIKNHVCGHVRFLNFNTEQERYNAWQSYLTKFARFCICMDESTKLAPYMGNYTQPWDDQRFYTYFGLTQPEIQLIETVIK